MADTKQAKQKANKKPRKNHVQKNNERLAHRKATKDGFYNSSSQRGYDRDIRNACKKYHCTKDKLPAGLDGNLQAKWMQKDVQKDISSQRHAANKDAQNDRWVHAIKPKVNTKIYDKIYDGINSKWQVKHADITSENQQRINKDIQKDWNRKCDDSKAEFLKNMKAMGYNVPDIKDTKAVDKLYNDTMKSSPDLFYNGLYVGTDPNALRKAKRAYKLKEDAAKAEKDIPLWEQKMSKAQREKLEHNKYSALLSQAADNVINSKLQGMMSDKVKKTLAKFGYDWTAEGCMQAVKDVVRGIKYAQYMSQDELDAVKKRTEKALDPIINKQAEKMADRLVDTAVDRITPITDKVASKATSTLDKIDKGLHKLDKYDKFDLQQKSAGDIVMNLTGKGGKLGKLAGSAQGQKVLGELSKSIDGSISSSKFSKAQGEQISKLQAIEKKVETLRNTIQNYRNAIKDLVTKWKNIVKDKIKAMTKKLLTNLLKKVHISAGGLKLKL